MERVCRPWTEEELNRALALYATPGMTWSRVGERLGRTKSSVIGAVQRHDSYEPTVRECQPVRPIGLEKSEISHRKLCRQASITLREAINALIDRMPSKTVAEMLGSPPLKIPGTERVIRGQAAERMAA